VKDFSRLLPFLQDRQMHSQTLKLVTHLHKLAAEVTSTDLI